MIEKIKERNLKYGKNSRGRKCCFLFKLETGVALIVLIDILMFFYAIFASNIYVEDNIEDDKTKNL